MYLALVVLLLATTILFQSVWLLLATIGLWLVLDRMIAVPEEKYLEAEFGDRFQDYKSQVGRWL
jgi:protein-S-isoprenylcysteine O-methyltransferase Ste14